MKEYLKMADVFDGAVTAKHIDSSCIHELRYGDESGNNYTLQDDGFWMLVRKERAEYASHAINSHDELVAEVERLRARVAELEEFTHHFCDNSYNVDFGGGDCTATTCEAKEMAHKLDNRVWPDLWPGH